MTAAQVRVWKNALPRRPGSTSHTACCYRQACILAARMETGNDLSVSSTHAVTATLSKLRPTPIIESKAWHLQDQHERFYQ